MNNIESSYLSNNPKKNRLSCKTKLSQQSSEQAADLANAQIALVPLDRINDDSADPGNSSISESVKS